MTTQQQGSRAIWQRAKAWTRSALFMLALLAGCSQAMAAGYVSSITTAYPLLATPSPTQIFATTAQLDDNVSTVIPLGFNFLFGATSYPNISVSTNGVIFFETSAVGSATSGNSTYTPATLPAAVLGNPIRPALMPFWADLWKNANTSFIEYQLLNTGTNTAPNRKLVINFRNVGYYGGNGVLVNFQVQMWESGQIVYTYGSMAAFNTSANSLAIGLQIGGTGGGCNQLANTQTTSLTNQSALFVWDPNGATCPQPPTVNHYEIRHDGSATLCSEPVQAFACSSATVPCPAANIVSSSNIVSAVTGAPTATPSSFTLNAGNPIQTVNLQWSSSAAATLAVTASVAASTTTKCTTIATVPLASTCNMVVAATACVAPPHHLEIVGPDNGATCGYNNFTIKAWADAAQTIPYTAGAITGNMTNAGTPTVAYSGGSAGFTIPVGSSSIVKSVGVTSQGTVTFGATITSTAATAATSCALGSGSSCVFTANSAALIFSNIANGSNMALPTHTAGTTSSAYYLRAVQTGTTTGVCTAALSGAQSVNWAYSCNNPTTCTTGNRTTITGTGPAGTTIQGNANGSFSNTTAVAMTFDANGNAPFTLNYTDAGMISLAATVPVSSTVLSQITGSSAQFAVKPGGFVLSNVKQTAAPNTANPAASNALGTLFVKAGESFTTTVTAVTSGGVVTPNFGNEVVTSPLAASVVLAPALILPSGGSVGVISNATVTGFVSGVATATNLSWSEVGIATLAGNLSNYLGLGNNTTGVASSNIGRFYPHHFDPVVAQGCPAGSFTYSGQPLFAVVTARNLTGGATTNYRSSSPYNSTTDFAKTVTLAAVDSLGGVIAGLTPSANTTNTFSTSGVGSSAPVFTFTTNPTSPIGLFVRATDTDAVTSSGYETLAVAGIRSGRIRLLNTYGSELLALPVPIKFEYYQGASAGQGWQANTADTCSGIAATQFAWDFLPSGTTARPQNLAACESRLALTGSNPLNYVLSLSAPGAGNQGWANLTLNLASASGNACTTVGAGTGPAAATANMGWLQFPTGTNPKARVTFGAYKSPLIYRRENY